jgi:trehalose 6-phosphate phosphatase
MPMPDDSPTLPTARPTLVDGGASLFLDFDGTLVDIAERPDAVEATPELRALIVALARRLDGRVAIVSGRPAHEILHYLHGEESVPPFALAGSHGVELMWSDGRRETPPPPEGRDALLSELYRFADAHPGVAIEDKPFGAAIHYRQAPDAGPSVDAMADGLGERLGFGVQRGKMVCELRGPGPDKGDAVARFLAEPPMQGTRPIFVGDDLTDDAGFAAAAARGGAGVLVGGPRATAASHRLADVAAVHAWLSDIAGESA